MVRDSVQLRIDLSSLKLEKSPHRCYFIVTYTVTCPNADTANPQCGEPFASRLDSVSITDDLPASGFVLGRRRRVDIMARTGRIAIN